MDKQKFDNARESLTLAQKNVLARFLQGQTDEEIAQSLNCTPSNIRKHFTNIYKKFDLVSDDGERQSFRDDLRYLFVKLKPELVADKFKSKTDILIESPEGSVPLDSQFYIERQPIESKCYEAVLQPGALIRIKAPKQMGKTSLLNRILKHSDNKGLKTVRLNFLQAETTIFDSLDKFLKWLCINVSENLQLPTEIEQEWKEGRGDIINCTNYFQSYILEQLDNPLVLAFDEVDRVFQFAEIAENFLPMLRSWYEEAKNLEIWENLRMVVVHSTDVYVPLDIHHSPFNVGFSVELNEFNLKQVQDLAKLHGLEWWGNLDAKKLMDLVGGHPYLVRMALFNLALKETSIDLTKLLHTAPTDTGIYCNHLQQILGTIQQYPELKAALQNVVTAEKAVQLKQMPTFKLKSMGLVKQQADGVTPSCELYKQYFRSKLQQ